MKTLVSFFIFAVCTGTRLLAGSLDEDFREPPVAVRPYVWWHWMGSLVSKEGITKDLEAMKAEGVGGATIFNLPSAVTEGASPTGNAPWPDITYRSPRYWELLKFATSEAARLGLELGIHNCVGYSATGGPWVTPELSMQHVVWTSTPVAGPFSGVLPKPQATLGFYRDIAVVAVPATDPVDPKAIVILTERLDANGRLTWTPPPGNWNVYRFGHTSTGRGPNPCPEDVKALEVDKMSALASRFHFEQVIAPLQEHLGAAIGTTFRHLTMDSYEAGSQNWTPAFRAEFLKRKSYDPVPWLPLLDMASVIDAKNKRHDVPKTTIGSADIGARFSWDFADVIAQLYQENNFEQGVRLMNAARLQLQFEAYSGPFDTVAGSAIADVPMGEFWTGGGGGIGRNIVGAAQAAGRRLVGAESLTGRPSNSAWSEDPAYLKTTGDGGYASGVNRLVLHHWVHQPFGDAFQPGMGMGWWGTHFGRNQTWFEPGKAYFAYLGRCQALLQRGEGEADFLCLEKARGNADVIPRAALLRGDVKVDRDQLVLPSGRRYPFLLLPDQDAMLPEVARVIQSLVAAGAIVVGPKPVRSPSLSGYPGCDDEIRKIGDALWADGAGKNAAPGKILAISPEQELKTLGITPLLQLSGQTGNLRTNARHEGDTAIFFLSNGGNDRRDFTASFRVAGKLPELWQAEDGSHAPAPLWKSVDGRTEVLLRLNGKQSVFVVFRQSIPAADHAVAVEVKPATAPGSDWRGAASADGSAVLRTTSALEGDVIYASGRRSAFKLAPEKPRPVEGPWNVNFAVAPGRSARALFPELKSWSDHANPEIKYFSGTATYLKEINLPASLLGPGHRVILDLGEVHNLARVRVNGVDLGVTWYSPFEIDATPALKSGPNTLEVAVTNTWANRLIGDEQEPEDMVWGNARNFGGKYVGRPLASYPDWFIKGQPRPSSGRQGFVTWNYFTKDSALLPAGLLGPVRLVPVAEFPLASRPLPPAAAGN